MGDVLTKTVSEYQAMSRWGRLGYRLYRHPVTLFLIGLGIWWYVESQPRGSLVPAKDGPVNDLVTT